MRCPACHNMENRVLESRAADSGQSVRRRRECLKCNHRFTTYERVEFAPLVVVKENGNREGFDREKLVRSLTRICERTAIGTAQVETMVSTIESALQQRTNREILSSEISELVLQELQPLSEAACIRYASVYCQFENITEFLATLARVNSDPANPSNSIEFAVAQSRSLN
ncbi:transcriptional regulator NrdR [Leptolyngbya sp. AN03gr2]|uniref:transcriptional regulator NrdR n=1 Tax=unclassified Leptolyngbya TaxID=2650499 RepID=UPI003D314525